MKYRKKNYWCPNGCGKKVQWYKRNPMTYGRYLIKYKCLSCNEILKKVGQNVFSQT